MVITLPTGIPHGSKSRARDPTIHSGVHELNDDYNSRNRGGNNHHNLRFSFKYMGWKQYYSYFSNIWRNSRFRFRLYNTHRWRSLYVRNNNKSSQPSIISNRDRKRNRHYFYYGLLISLLSIAPVKAETPEETNVSNPVAAATGNVTNQAVQFQNNGAPSRQHYGPNISCNGSTMTFSPFYMGNHTTPFDEDLIQQTYTIAENWGFQVNFMIHLDKESLNRCRSIAARQEEKMRLDYELVRSLKCAELQDKGYTFRPGSRVAHMCSDIIPIAALIPPKPPEKKKLWPF